MAGASIHIDVEYNDREIVAALKRLQEIGGNLDAAFGEIGEYLLESHKQRFEDQVSPDGEPWEPLDPKSVTRKKRNADKILIEYGHLLGSLHYNLTSSGLEFGTNLIYGATHQFGDEDRGIRARPFIGISVDDEREIISIIGEHILARLEASAWNRF